MFFGVAVFNFEGNAIILSLHKSMREPYKFNKLMRFLIFIVIIVVITVASIGYAGFGDQI